MLFLDIGCISDKGNKRKINQDRVLSLKNDDSALFVVADGMGGMDSGEYASTFLIKEMHSWWDKNELNFADLESDKITDMIYYKINQINNSLVDYCKKNNMKTGTTLSLIFMHDDYAIAAYSGDTRIYHIGSENNVVSQVSEDETLYNYYEKYENTSEEKNFKRNKSILFSYIGRANSVSVSFKEIKIKQGDMFIICTDGFYNYFNVYEDKNISQMINLKAQQACESFAADVKKKEAADNLSIVFIKCM